jgi:hypothetical protein
VAAPERASSPALLETSAAPRAPEKEEVFCGDQVELVETEGQLASVLVNESAFKDSAGVEVVAIDCRGVPETLALIQVAVPGKVYLFDCVKLPVRDVCSGLMPLLSSDTIKLVHDLHLLVYFMNASIDGGFPAHALGTLLDSQLVAEHLYGELHCSVEDLLKKLSCPINPTKYAMKAKLAQSPGLWSKRPLSATSIKSAAHDAMLLLDAWQTLLGRLTPTALPALIIASEERAVSAIARDGAHSLTFDIANDYALASPELLSATRPDDAFILHPLVPKVDAADIIDLLPSDLRQQFLTDAQTRGAPADANPLIGLFLPRTISNTQGETSPTIRIEQVSDIVIDIGRRPHCWAGSERSFLVSAEGRVGEEKDVKFVNGRVGGFGSDNRAGIDGKLHRISAIINRDGRVAGLTMRLGRSVTGWPT